MENWQNEWEFFSTRKKVPGKCLLVFLSFFIHVDILLDRATAREREDVDIIYFSLDGAGMDLSIFPFLGKLMMMGVHGASLSWFAFSSPSSSPPTASHPELNQPP